MAKITDLLAVDAITGDEFLPIVQGGATKRATMSALRALIVPFLQYWYRGDKGDPGAAGNVAATLAQLRAAAITHGTMIASYDGSGSTMTWTPGDFTALGAARPADYVASDDHPLTAGAWVRQGAGGIQYLAGYAGARPRRHGDKSSEVVSVLDFGAKGDGVTDDTAAFDAAIATGKKVSVPWTAAGYAVNGVRVIDGMHVAGEKSGVSNAPMLIVTTDGMSAFYNDAGMDVFDVTIENFRCMAAPGVKGAYFYDQSTRTRYSAYFEFRSIETYRSLLAGYKGLFIYSLWDRVRDGYKGNQNNPEHTAVLALAESYNQTNRQNINRFVGSRFFSAFGGQGAIVASYGTLWLFDACGFEAVQTAAFRGYNMTQVRFRECWFEGVRATALVALSDYPGTLAGSSASFDHCTFVCTNPDISFVVTIENGQLSFRSNVFNLVPAAARLTNRGAAVTVNEDNLVDGAGEAGFMVGMHADSYANGRRALNGARDNGVARMTLQNAGGIAATAGFMSDDNIAVGTDFVTIATSATGLGGTVVISGFDPGNDGLQFRILKDWHADTVRDVVAPLNGTPKVFSFQTVGNDLRMKVDVGSVLVFTTLLN